MEPVLETHRNEYESGTYPGKQVLNLITLNGNRKLFWRSKWYVARDSRISYEYISGLHFIANFASFFLILFGSYTGKLSTEYL